MVDLFITKLLAWWDVNNGLEACELLVDSCNVFIGCLDSHSDGTHSLMVSKTSSQTVDLNLEIII